MAVEEPVYEVVAEQDGIEYRRYSAYMIAQTVLPADAGRSAAANAAFFILFKYISGANSGSQDIAMTAPVLQSQAQDSGVKISMTAPVSQVRDEQGWKVAFVLPAMYSLENAPKPVDSRVELKEVPSRLVAALRYKGRWTEKNFQKYAARLTAALDAHGARVSGVPVSAYYNAPFVLPFLRRNEVLVEVAAVPEF